MIIIVLSLGGGTPCYHDNMSLILSYTTNFFIDVNSEVFLKDYLRKREKTTYFINWNKRWNETIYQ